MPTFDSLDCQLCDGTGLVDGRAAGPKPEQLKAAIAEGANFCRCQCGALARMAAGGTEGAGELLAAAPAPKPKTQSPRQVVGAAFNRSRVEAFLRRLAEISPRRITRADLWRAAGYRDPTEFKRWQRGAPVSPGCSARFNRLLATDPRQFLASLQADPRRGKILSPAIPHIRRAEVLISISSSGAQSGVEANSMQVPNVNVQILLQFGAAGSPGGRRRRVGGIERELNAAQARGLVDLVLGDVGGGASSAGPGGLATGPQQAAAIGRILELLGETEPVTRGEGGSIRRRAGSGTGE